MTKRILTVGFELALDATRADFDSKTSLLDWDIFLFRPTIEDFISYGHGEFQGRPSLDERNSFRVKEACEHWRREIKQAIEHGKTVVIFLPPIKEIFVKTGEKQYSGTGRNQKTTNIVAQYSNYEALPVSLTPVNANGQSMKLAPNAEILASYWKEFGPRSLYQVKLSENLPGVAITTKTGNVPLGAILQLKDMTGFIVLLPDMDFIAEEFFDEVEDSDGSEDDDPWSPEGKRFAHLLISAIVNLDNGLRSSTERTPEPDWAVGQLYTLAKEQELRAELLNAERDVEEAQKRKEDVIERLKSAGSLRALLYEKGKPLEHAIIEALQVIGFQAAPYRDSESEFDVVFESAEGRLLGEAEGKDNKAVNVDKLRQLMMNIQEDLLREAVDVPAKGILFGNGYRLTDPKDREVQFTAKCATAAKASNTALVSTADLYRSAQFLSDTKDHPDYAKSVRQAMLTGTGIVALPSPPEIPIIASEDVKS